MSAGAAACGPGLGLVGHLTVDREVDGVAVRGRTGVARGRPDEQPAGPRRPGRGGRCTACHRSEAADGVAGSSRPCRRSRWPRLTPCACALWKPSASGPSSSARSAAAKPSLAGPIVRVIRFLLAGSEVGERNTVPRNPGRSRDSGVRLYSVRVLRPERLRALALVLHGVLALTAGGHKPRRGAVGREAVREAVENGCVGDRPGQSGER